MKTKEKIMCGFYEEQIIICDMCKGKYTHSSNSKLSSPIRKCLHPEVYDLCPKCFQAIENRIREGKIIKGEK